MSQKNEEDNGMEVAMVAIGIIVLVILVAGGARITGVNILGIGLDISPAGKSSTDSKPTDRPSPSPIVSQKPIPSPSFGAAPESWCLGMRDQWKVRKDQWGKDDESIKKSMEEQGCFNYPGVKLE